MKYLKSYRLFEEFELLDRGFSDQLKGEFKSDIGDLCLELEDIYPISISFDDSKYRKSNSTTHMREYDRGVWKSNYPSITISREGEYRGQMSKIPIKTGKGSGWYNTKLIENWNNTCLSVALRIKSYLSDSFILFTINDKGDERSFDLNDVTKSSSLGPFPRLNIETLKQGDIKRFRIIYNPNLYKI